MGLDASAYSEIAKIDCLFDEDQEPVDPETRESLDYDTYVQVYVNPDFKDHAKGLEHKAVYSFRDSTGLSAGAYSSYNGWREDLAKLAGYPAGQYEEWGTKYYSHCVPCWNGERGPFSEMINFSDCEGFIDAETSKKLAADFAQFQDKADAIGDEYFRKKYSAWRELFELAANNGCVEFH